MTTERHPWEPFLPAAAHLLMLGSFPPGRHRWSMDFYYPNLQNQMWRIMGLLFFGDKEHFLTADRRHYDQPRVEAFCRERGIALYDTAAEVIRLRDNASDNFLQVVRATDVGALLRRIPLCTEVVATGGKATETLCALFGCEAPAIGGYTEFGFEGRAMRLWRMPSSSAALARKVEWKAEFYRRLFPELQ